MLAIETLLYQLAYWLMAPVLAAIVLLLMYSLYACGRFLAEWYQRRVRKMAGPLTRQAAQDTDWKSEQLELHILSELEGLKITARTAPLLGLVATMIPMGPALAGVASGDMVSVGEQVGVAFAAVIIALMAASMAYIILTVKRRWRLKELHQLEQQREAAV